MSYSQRVDDLGAQGGDVGRHVALDLSSCVNPYGPAPAVLDALREMPADTLRVHPYEATSVVEDLYSKWLCVDRNQLVAVRGASEALWQLARIIAGRRVALPLPTYTEYLRAFPNAVGVENVNPWHSVDQLEDAAEQGDVVVFSNPHNPTGLSLSRSEVMSVVDANQHCLFVVDESYADFVGVREESIIDEARNNLVVVRSPTKFFGIGGVRVGVVATTNSTVRNGLLECRTTWPLSMIEARVLEAAFADVDWQVWARHQLKLDVSWLDEWLSSWLGIHVVRSPLHFRLVTSAHMEEYQTLVNALQRADVHVRALTPRHGFDGPAMRIAAPRESDRNVLPATC